jgi:hypothetical protein
MKGWWLQRLPKKYIDASAVVHGMKQKSHKFSAGDIADDLTEPTPSPEANMVQIIEQTDKRADEYVIDGLGQTVDEYNDYYCNPDSLVVIGFYPNMGGSNEEFAFPESRLRKI